MADRGKLEAAVFDAMMPVSCQNDKTGAAVSTCSVVTDIVNAIEEVLREPADPPRPFTPEQAQLADRLDGLASDLASAFLCGWPPVLADSGGPLLDRVDDIRLAARLLRQPPAERETPPLANRWLACTTCGQEHQHHPDCPVLRAQLTPHLSLTADDIAHGFSKETAK